MIQNLILKMINLLVETFASEIPNTAQHIQANVVELPNGSNLPQIVLRPGLFTIRAQPGESTATPARPDEIRQKLSVSATSPLGPYSLVHTPLQGSIRCKIFFAEGTVLERQIWLQETADFAINYNTNECVFITDVSEADSILLIYSFVTIFVLQEFFQDLLIDIYALTANQMEQLSSLVGGTLLVHHDAIVTACNQDLAFMTKYAASSVGTIHQLNRIQFLEGKPDYTSTLKTQLTFKVSGQLKATRAITDGFGLIEKIHSPGRSSEQPIDIAINVE